MTTRYLLSCKAKLYFGTYSEKEQSVNKYITYFAIQNEIPGDTAEKSRI
jgi:hypothetical protein